MNDSFFRLGSESVHKQTGLNDSLTNQTQSISPVKMPPFLAAFVPEINVCLFLFIFPKGNRDL